MYAATSGYRNDGDAGLVHVGARYYDAQVGRFTSRDTVLTEHPYLYCEHDPVNSTDPTGHSAWWQIVTPISSAPFWAVVGPPLAATVLIVSYIQMKHEERMYELQRASAASSMREMRRARLALEKQRLEYEQRIEKMERDIKSRQ
jgi:RHS repeat-associated protein